MPTVEQLQGDLDLDFEAAWTEMINTAAAGLDSNGKLNVANRLPTISRRQSSTAVRREGEARQPAGESTYPRLWRRVKEALVKEQQDQLIDALKEVVTKDMPGQQRCAALAVADRKPAKYLTTRWSEKHAAELRGRCSSSRLPLCRTPQITLCRMVSRN